MKHEYANCSLCGGFVEERRVTVDYRMMTGLVIIENVPAGVCRQCGEQYYMAKVAKAMEALAGAQESATRMLPVPVREFPESSVG